MEPRVRWLYAATVALPLIVLTGGWVAWSEMRTGVTEITITTLFIAVAFLLFALTGVNRVVRRAFGERAALTQAELLVVYALLSVATAIAGIGNIGFFTPFLGNAYRFANAGNAWDQWHPYLPKWMGPADPEILRGFYEGRVNFFQPEILRAWAFPLAAWTVLLLTLYWTTLCFAALLRRRWMDDEHLTFPVVALPLEMTRDDAPLAKNRLLWFGFALPCALHSWNTVANLFPTFPTFPINTASQLLDGIGPPLNGLGSVMILVHPAGIGFSYLVNTDILFSLLFFYGLKKVLNLIGTGLNWRDPGPSEYGDGSAQFPFTGYQSWGAWLTIGIAALWSARGYLKGVLDRALSDRKGFPEDDGEPLTARQAFWGFLGGYLAVCGLCVVAGITAWIPFAVFAIYLLLMLALARVEAETAVLSPLLAWVSPHAILTTTLGTGSLSRPELTQIASLVWFNQDYRAAVMPQQLQGFVALRRAGVRDLRPLTPLILFACLVGLVSAILWDMSFYYDQGASTANVNAYRINMGNVPWWTLSGWLGQPKPPDLQAVAGTGVGSAVVVLLAYLRTRFIGFPLSPAAYALTTSFAVELFWLDVAFAFLLKSAFLRYGGMRLYRATLPFFLGLILGDFVTGAAWNLFGTLTGIPLFRTFPN
jgi:hypothetical protein